MQKKVYKYLQEYANRTIVVNRIVSFIYYSIKEEEFRISKYYFYVKITKKNNCRVAYGARENVKDYKSIILELTREEVGKYDRYNIKELTEEIRDRLSESIKEAKQELRRKVDRFIVYNKKYEEGNICDSLATVSRVTGLNIHTLYHYFSREKVDKYKSKNWVVERAQIIYKKDLK